ncbi:MAG: RNase adapter RapZ [Armatimonadetes bacterium]|nr:RNase adapter RapZ [Armatimonadota bacterium]
MAKSKFIIITGLSGAGKSLASRCFEDLNYFCVDNLPPALLPKFAQLCGSSEIDNVALVIDIRGREFFGDFLSALDQMRHEGVNFQVVFLEGSDKVLVRRFSETRRKHPLSTGGRILDDIQLERKMLASVKSRADVIIDTSALAPQQLKEEIARLMAKPSNGSPLSVTVVSFGFKHGLPVDADMVLDVRFLTNPYYVSKLRHLTGNDDEVKKYVLKQPKAKEFLKHLFGITDFLLPQYVDEGKSHFTIGVGCTGGKHRSICLANELAGHLEHKNFKVVVEHRDIFR